MLFSKKALGIEICSDGARFALVAGRQDEPLLTAFTSARFQGDTLRLSLRDENVRNPGAFVDTIRQQLARLPGKARQVSLSLPDSTGRVIIMDLETRFKSREEGMDIIRWKLKKNYPFDINEAHLDYQTIQEKASGDVSILVSLIARPIVLQYEALFLEAGLEPKQIDFTSFNLYTLFSRRLELSPNSMLVTYHDGILGIMIFYDGNLEFFRSKEVPVGTPESNRFFREINSSFHLFKEKFPGHAPTEGFCVYPEDDAESFRSLVAEATGIDPVLLDAEKAVSRARCPEADGRTLRPLAAAVGAAMRSL